MPNKHTFLIKPIKSLLERCVLQKNGWIDPFANSSKIAETTNDLNPEYDTDYHMDAIDFVKMFSDNSVDGVLYDPPYSPRQISECYKGIGIKPTMQTTQSSWRANQLNEIARVVRYGGTVICFGWNSNGMGIKRGFILNEILLVAHGGSHYDTIVTVETKIEPVLIV